MEPKPAQKIVDLGNEIALLGYKIESEAKELVTIFNQMVTEGPGPYTAAGHDLLVSVTEARLAYMGALFSNGLTARAQLDRMIAELDTGEEATS